MFKLNHSAASPFCRKVDVVLHETGQFDQVEAIHEPTNAVTTGATPIAANPLGKIPALVREDGPALFDSRVICRFFDARAGGKLYPKSREWEVLTLEALADGITEAALAMVYERRFKPAEQQNEAWIEGQWTKAARGLDALESQWMSHLEGPLTIGQIAVGCALGYLDLRHSDRDWRAGRDVLAAWEAKFADRPSMRATVPQG